MPPQQRGPWDNYDGPWKQYQSQQQPKQAPAGSPLTPTPPRIEEPPLKRGLTAGMETVTDILEPFSFRDTQGWRIPPAVAAVKEIPEALKQFGGLGQLLHPMLPPSVAAAPDSEAGFKMWSATKEAALAPVKPPIEFGKAALAGDIEGMTKGAADTIKTTLPTIYGAKQFGRGAKAYMGEQAIQTGRTTRSTGTGMPTPRAAPVQVKLGEAVPDDIPTGLKAEFDPHINTAARALGGDKALDQGLALKDRLSLVAHELAEARQEAPSVRTSKLFGRQFKDWNDVRLQTDYARKKLWDSYVEPGLDTTMRVQPILDDFMKNLPRDIQLFDPQAFEPIYQKFKSIFDMTPEIRVRDMQGLAARIREQIDLSSNAFDRFGDLSVVKTAANKAFEDAIRKNIYDHIEAMSGVDIRPAMRKYGALSEIQQDVLKMPEPQSFLEKILSSYTFPTQRAVAARLGETMAKTQLGKISLWNRAMSYPLDRGQLIQAVPVSRYIDESRQLGAGPPQLGEQPDTSFVKGEPAFPRRGLLTEAPNIMNVTGGHGPIVGPSSTVQLMPESSAARATRLRPERAITSGQKLLPPVGGSAAPLIPEQPPESFAEALKRTETPRSRRMREVLGEGPYERQAQPISPTEYKETKGGRAVQEPGTGKVWETPPPGAPRKPVVNDIFRFQGRNLTWNGRNWIG